MPAVKRAQRLLDSPYPSTATKILKLPTLLILVKPNTVKVDKFLRTGKLEWQVHSTAKRAKFQPNITMLGKVKHHTVNPDKLQPNTAKLVQ
jgi:hypothetical protein